MLADRSWQRKYTPDDGDLVRLFYVPALEDAERYDRLTGYFNAGALALAARGIEGLVRNRGHMRLVVGCTLPPAEIAEAEGDRLERADSDRGVVLGGRERRPLPVAQLERLQGAIFRAIPWAVSVASVTLRPSATRPGTSTLVTRYPPPGSSSMWSRMVASFIVSVASSPSPSASWACP